MTRTTINNRNLMAEFENSNAYETYKSVIEALTNGGYYSKAIAEDIAEVIYELSDITGYEPDYLFDIHFNMTAEFRNGKYTEDETESDIFEQFVRITLELDWDENN